jgi:hypothetical protein
MNAEMLPLDVTKKQAPGTSKDVGIRSHLAIGSAAIA